MLSVYGDSVAKATQWRRPNVAGGCNLVAVLPPLHAVYNSEYSGCCWHIKGLL